MANEPTVKLAANAMTTLEDTMERLGIPHVTYTLAVQEHHPAYQFGVCLD